MMRLPKLSAKNLVYSYLALITGLVAIFTLIGLFEKVSTHILDQVSITHTLPSRHMGDSDDGNDANDPNTLQIDISEACQPYPNCAGRQLEAPASYAKLYFRSQNNLRVRVWRDNDPTKMRIGDASEVRFRFRSTNKNEGIRGCGATFTRTLDQLSFGPDDWSQAILLDFGDCPPLLSNNVGLYVVQAIVDFQPRRDDRWFNFKLQAWCSGSGGNRAGVCEGTNNANRAGFWAQLDEPDLPIALETDRFYEDGYFYNIHIPFGAPCRDVPGSFRLIWQDADHADAGGNPPNPGIRWELYRDRAGGGDNFVRIEQARGGSEMGGNGDKKGRTIGNVQAGDRYQWVWHHILHNNDPQIWVPFDSVTYAIECLEYENIATVLGSPSFPPGPKANQVEPGQTYEIDTELKNIGDGGNDEDVYLRIHEELNEQMTTAEQALDFGSDADGLGFGSDANCGSRAPCYWWRYAPDKLDPGQVKQPRFRFTVTVDATEGSQICFRAYAARHTPAIAEYQGNQRCVTVVRPREPFLTTAQGSVHAGARWGSQPCLSPEDVNPIASIRGTVRATGSKADYIVSARGSITNFGSAGGVNTNDLTFRNKSVPRGFYGQVCRPDLAARYLADPAIPVDGRDTIAANALNNGIYKHTGNVTITGGNIQVGQRSTLVVEGDVLITGNIGSNGPFSLDTIPSLGIITTGNIYIAANVSSLYGIFYAGSGIDPTAGIINTCQNSLDRSKFDPPITVTASACGQPLTVNGSLVANNIYFRRTVGDANQPTSVAAETINYLPQLLLRPPEGLGGVTAQIRFEGERPPVF